MEKVKISKEQAVGIECIKSSILSNIKELKHFPGRFYEEERPAAELEIEVIKSAVFEGYEVEPEFEVGDWVYDMHHNKVARIDHRGVDDDRVWVDDDELNFFSIVDIRHATQEEIQQEKERRFFNEHSRKPWELKVGDVLVKKMDNFPLVVTEVNAEEITLNLLTCTRSEVKKCCKVLCFADDRLDVSAE